MPTDDFKEKVREDAEESLWMNLRHRANDAVERLGLADGALPERRE